MKSLKFFVGWLQAYARIALRQPGFTYSTCRPFTEHREGIQIQRNV